MVRTRKRAMNVMTFIFILIIAVFFVMPFIPLIIWSFTKQWPWPDLLPEELTLQSWMYVFSDTGRALQGLSNSFFIALLTLIINLLIGIPAARVLAQKEFAGKLIVFFIFLSPLFIPFTVSTIGMYKFSLQIDFLNDYIRVTFAHVFMTFPYFLTAIWYQYRLMGLKMQEAAQSLGASNWQIFRWIEFPHLFPALSLASVFVLIISFSQYLPTWIMSGGAMQTLPLIMFPFASSGDASLVSAYSILFFLLIISVLLLHFFLIRLGTHMRKSTDKY